MRTPTVWVLQDDRAGNVNQLLGVAEALGFPFEVKKITYTKWVKLPNVLRVNPFLGIWEKELLKGPYPDIVISAGRRAFPVACALKKLSGEKTKIVQLMDPGFGGRNWADLLVIPRHDACKKITLQTLVITGCPHRVTANRLKQERAHWANVFKSYPEPRGTLIVGGATKNKPFTVKMAKTLLEQTLKLGVKSLIITTSRRTPPAVVEFLKSHIQLPHFMYCFGDKAENPYFGLLAWGDKIVVTGDSMSMCSECASTPAPTYIFAPKGMMSPKHERFHASLYQAGYAFPLGEKGTSATAPNPADVIAKEIKKRFM